MKPTVGLKEWALICEALAAGWQSVLFRTGGIHESGDRFRFEHENFWLYPTGFHQSLDAIRPEDRDVARWMLAVSPYRAGDIPLRHYATVVAVEWIGVESRLEEFRDRHILSDETVKERFHYRRPGLFAISLKVTSLPEPVWIPELPEYAGCRSWVELPAELDAWRPV